MRPAVLLVALGLCAAPAVIHAATVTSSAAKPREELVRWDQEGDFASALARAKKAKKLVFVDFYATWCGPCKMMDRDVYSDSTVAKASTKYVTRKVDAEKGEGIALSQKYAVEAYPTLLIVDGEGKEVNREVGFRDGKRFVSFLDDTRTGKGTVAGLEAIIAGGDDTYENRALLGEKYVKRGEMAKAREQFNLALAKSPDDPQGKAAELLLTLARTEAATGDAAGAVTDYATFLEKFPAHGRRSEALAGKASAHAAAGDTTAAVDTYRMIAQEHPKDGLVLASFARFCVLMRSSLDEAMVNAKRAIELTESRNASAFDALADVYAAKGQYDDAVYTSEQALAMSPNDGYLRGRLESFQEQAVAAVKNKAR